MTEEYPDRHLYIEGECVCVYCGFDGTVNHAAWHQLMIEHVIPLRCKPTERERSALNVAENKVVACFTCNNIKRIWDKKYDESKFPGTLPEQVVSAIASAKQFLADRYAKIDSDYEPMMDEIRKRKAKSIA